MSSRRAAAAFLEFPKMEVFMDTAQRDGLSETPDAVCSDEPTILEEIEVEDLAVDGICGVY